MSRTDALTALTIGELDGLSRQLKADVVTAITEGTADKSKALALVLWAHRRRTDPAAKLAPVLDMPFLAVNDELTALYPAADDAVAQALADQEDSSPTEPAPGS